MAGKTLASAWVSVGPTGFADFGRKARDGIKAALKGTDATVPVKADTKPATTDLDRFKAKLAEFSRTVATARAGVDTKQGAAALAKMDVSLDRLNRKVASPRVTLEGIKAAEAELLGFEASFDRLDKKKASPKIDTSGLAGPGLGVSAALLAPAAIPLAAGLIGPLAAVTTSLGGAGIAAGAFGLLAKQNFSIASKAAQQVQTAQDAYNVAIQAGVPTARAQATLQAANAKAQLTYSAALKAGANPAKTLAAYHATLAKNQLAYNSATKSGVYQAQAYRTQQIAISKAYSELSPQQIALSKQVGDLSNAWQGVQQATTPVISGALLPWMSAATKALTYIQPLVTPVAAVFRTWGQDLDRYFSSAKGSAELHRIATELGRFGAGQMRDIGTFLIDAGKAIANLGRDLAGHNVDFGAFGQHLAAWGAAFLKWSQSAQARRDVTTLLDYVRSSGKTVATLLGNLGTVLAKLSPGLASAGQLELRLITDFLGFVAKLPQGLAKPLLDTAGALLLLSKTGVLKIGIQIVGAAAKWLTGGLIDIGGGASAAAAIRAAFATGGAEAAAEIRAAMAEGGAASAGGAAGAAGAAGKVAGGSFLAGFSGPLLLGAAGIASGFILRFRQDFAQGWQGFLRDLPGLFGGVGGILNVSASGWANAIEAKFDKPARQIMSGFGHFVAGSFDQTRNKIAGSFDQTRHDAASLWDNLTGGAKLAWQSITGSAQTGSAKVNSAFGASGQKADALRTQNLVPLQGEFGKVQGGIQNLSGTMQGTYANAMRTAGQRSDSMRTQNLAPLLGELGRVSGGVQGLQSSINAMHGKTVTVGANATASGTISIVGAGWAAGQGNIRFHAAGGGLVSYGTGPTADDVPAMLSRGELVVPTAMVKAGAVDHLRGMLPGFAGGGLVGASGLEGMLAGLTGSAASFTGNDAKQAVTTGITEAMAAAKAAVLKAVEASISAAGSAGLPGPGGAGTLSAVAIEGYWTRAGGPGGQTANIAQAITVPESGRRPGAVQQGQPYATTGWGLWQITPGNSEPQAGINSALLNPANNAIAAVAKYRGAGGFTPWTTYVNGLYRPYLLAGGGLVPGYAAGGTVPDASVWKASFMADQAQEYRAWANLYGLSRKLPSARPALHALAAAQSLEEAGYDRVLGGGNSPGNLALLAGRLRKVIAAAQVGTLAHGAHPAWDKGVQQWANSLLAMATGANPPQFVGSPGKLTGGPNAPWQPLNLGPVMSAPGGVLTFDRGGYLPPGPSMTWNGTGRPEYVSPPGAGAGSVEVHLHVHGPVGSQSELEDWLIRSMNKMARIGRLSQAVRVAGGG